MIFHNDAFAVVINVFTFSSYSFASAASVDSKRVTSTGVVLEAAMYELPGVEPVYNPYSSAYSEAVKAFNAHSFVKWQFV